ncbi:MAG: hypothetical protein F7C35_06475 [Desulfurococcales archaeon]|nr:hypothetical protein [Desulfurococcales archaeon]
MPGERGRVAIVIIALLIILVMAVAYYNYSTSCDVKIEKVCLTENMTRIVVKGGCEGMELRIIDKLGNKVYQSEIRPGDNLYKVNLSPSSVYMVEIVYKWRTLATVDNVRVQPGPPMITEALAKLVDNDTLIVFTRGVTSCLVDDYHIKKISLLVVYQNGTSTNITIEGSWPINKQFTVKLPQPVNINELSSAGVFITDTLDITYQATTGWPR